jgi:hypothetical protein
MIPRPLLPIHAALACLLLLVQAVFPADNPTSEIAKDHIDVAVDRANKYLMSRQAPDGSISDSKNKTAMTALAIMAMAATGNQPIDPTPEGKAMRRAIDFVIDPKNQDDNGYFGKDGSRMYGHGIITLMLSEMLGMGLDDKQDKLTRESCQKAIDLILSAQKYKKEWKHQGGWRYAPDAGDADLSVSVWQLMALRSAKNSGLKVPASAIQEAVEYLKRSYKSELDAKGNPTEKKSGFAYQPGGSPEFTMCAAGLLAMQVCGEYESPFVHGACQTPKILLLRHLLLLPRHVPKGWRPRQGCKEKRGRSPYQNAVPGWCLAWLRPRRQCGESLLHRHGRPRLGSKIPLLTHLPTVTRPWGTMDIGHTTPYLSAYEADGYR